MRLVEKLKKKTKTEKERERETKVEDRSQKKSMEKIH